MNYIQNITLIVLSILLFSFIGCSPDNNEYKSKKTINNHSSKNHYNQVGLYLAGKKSETFSKHQLKDYYRNFVAHIDSSWNSSTKNNLIEITKWSRSNFPLVIEDTTTLFYPFSGPDFLYANAFFPKANTYIMIGLENPGQLPGINEMNDLQKKEYLNKLWHSLRFINQSGYFSTKQMMTDFADSSMNGIIHLLFHYISKTGHEISGLSAVEIDDYGDLKEKDEFQVEDKNPNGICIRFFKGDPEITKSLYYFPIDLSDENMKDNIGFLNFLSSFGPKNTFMKSASYILHESDFQIIRALILKQSKNILQDDSGIPFSILKKSKLELKIFGNYSRTIKAFTKNYQSDLQIALQKENSGQLSFKLGYNSWQNEMVLIHARTPNELTPSMHDKFKKVSFKIQFKSSWKKIPMDSSIFKALPEVDYYFRDGFYKYTIGKFTTEKACDSLLQFAVKQGFTDAFVVAFYQNNRISLEEAAKLMN